METDVTNIFRNILEIVEKIEKAQIVAKQAIEIPNMVNLIDTYFDRFDLGEIDITEIQVDTYFRVHTKVHHLKKSTLELEIVPKKYFRITISGRDKEDNTFVETASIGTKYTNERETLLHAYRFVIFMQHNKKLFQRLNEELTKRLNEMNEKLNEIQKTVTKFLLFLKMLKGE